MSRSAVFALAVLLVRPALAEECTSHASCDARVVKREAVRYVHDAKSIAAAPLHWDDEQWARFGEGVAAVGIVYAADRPLIDEVQRHRSSFTDDFASTVTPFGARRALNISILMVLGGAAFGDETLRDAGRDAVESDIFAAGIVTPLLKRGFGRARPIQEEGASSFHPGNHNYASFPSGHATNAFATATAIAAHYDGWVVPTIVYSLATGVAMSRVNDRAHFPSDVLAGALIGRAVAKAVTARHAAPRPAAWHVLPVVDGRSVGLVVTWHIEN